MQSSAPLVATVPTMDLNLWDPENNVYTISDQGDITWTRQSQALGRTIEALVRGKEHCTASTVSAAKIERVLSLVDKVYERLRAKLSVLQQFTSKEKVQLELIQRALREEVVKKDKAAEDALRGIIQPSTRLHNYVPQTTLQQELQAAVAKEVDINWLNQIGLHYCLASSKKREQELFQAAKTIYCNNFVRLLVAGVDMSYPCTHIIIIDPNFQWLCPFIDKDPQDAIVIRVLNELEHSLPYTAVTSDTRALFEVFNELYKVLVQSLSSSLALHAATLFMFICDERVDWISSFAQKKPVDSAIQILLCMLRTNSTCKRLITLQARELLYAFDEIFKKLQVQALGCSDAELLGLTAVFVQGAKTAALDSVVQKVDRAVSDDTKKCQIVVSYLVVLAWLACTNTRYCSLLQTCMQHMLRYDTLFFKELLLQAAGDSLKLIVESFSKTSPEAGSFADRLLKRYTQLAKGQALFSKLYAGALFQQAYFIETTASQPSFVARLYRNSVHLPRSIQTDCVTGDCIIKSKVKPASGDATFRLEGLMKKVIKSLYVPYDVKLSPSIVARAVPKDKVDALTHDEIYAIMQRELFAYQLLGNVEGIWPLLSWCRYEKTKGLETFSKLSLIFPIADGDMEEFSCSLPLKLQYMKNLAHGLWHMHKNGIVHLDIKAPNALRNDTCAGWIDFGHYFQPSVESLPVWNAIRSGHYGTYIFTAPELLLNTSFSGDYTKLDVWALGCMFYKMLRGEYPPWIEEHVGPLPDQIVTYTLSPLMHQKITVAIEVPRVKLEAKVQKTKNDLLNGLLYNMLRRDPNQRWNMKQVLDHLIVLNSMA